MKILPRKSRSGFAAAIIAIALGAAGTTLAQSEGEVTFWNSIKDSKVAAEYQAYLQAFPNGVFAPLARIRVQQLGGSAGAPPQTPPRQTQTAPPANTLNGSPQIVAEIQTKLFNLNYDITRFDGVMDDATTQAIKEWQERVDFPATGHLTDSQLERLRNSRAPQVWGSLAYTANGAVGRAWNRPSRKDAEDTALAECRRRAGRNAECSTQSAADSACLSAATYRATIGETVYFGARVSLKPRLQEAIDAALEQCRSADKSNGTCATRVSFCADGSHER